MDPTNTPVEITLNNGKKHKLWFDLNSFSEFETQAGKTLPAFLVELEQAFAPLIGKTANGKEPDPFVLTRALSRLSVKDLRALIWASLIEYDANDEPRRPYTIGKLGRLIDNSNITTVIGSLMTGITNSMPRPKKDEEPKKENPIASPAAIPVNGGNESGLSDEEILDSLALKSDG